MRLSPASRVVAPMLALFLVCGWPQGGAGSAHAQSTPAGPPVELDLQRLLFDGGRDTFQDPVWRIEPGPGRRVVMLPLAVRPVDADTELSRLPISLRGGRLVGFVVPRQQGGFNAPGESIDFARFTNDDPDAFEQLLFGSPDDDPATDPNNPDPFDAPGSFDEFGNNDDGGFDDFGDDGFGGGDTGGGLEVDQTPYGPVPTSAPRLARRLILHADGSVSWGLDRGFPSAEVAAGGTDNLYPLKLDPARLREQEPPRAERITRQDGEDARAYADRRRQAQQEQREKELAFRALRDSLRDLPTEFRVPTPPVIYAVIEAPESDELSVQGASSRPWTLRSVDRERIGRVAQSGGGRGGEEDRALWSAINSQLDDGHPLTQRAIALAVLRGNTAGSVNEVGTAFSVHAKLLTVEDPVARRIALYAVTRADPPTRATTRLLEIAGQSAQGEQRELLQLASLRAMFRVDSDKPDNTGFLITQVNEAIADPNGPPAARVIEELLRSLDRMASDGGAEALERVAVVMVNRMDFDVIPDDEADQVIATVIRNAPENPIAAGWLDVKLLRGNNADRADRTLELLSQAGAESALVRPLTESLRGLVLTAPAGDAPQSTAIALNGTIPLDSSNHGLIRAFDSTDPARRTLAWQVLRHFHVESARSGIEAAPTPDTAAQTFNLILSKALAQPRTPEYLVAFIDRQRADEVRSIATQSMLRLLLEPATDPAVAEQAARHIVASDRSYDQALRALEPAGRLRAIQSLYAAINGEVPLVVGLAADPAGSMADWFAQRLAAGELPTARDWAEHAGDPSFGGEQRLLQTAAADNPDAATAAAAALVINAGGTATDQAKFSAAIGRMAPRSPDAVHAAWDTLKLELYGRALARAQGVYQLVVTLHEQPGFQPVQEFDEFDEFGSPPAPADTPTTRRVELGLVELSARGTTVSLSVAAVPVAVADDRLAIRLLEPASLRTFSNPDLADLPLSQMNQPIDLLPRGDGSWSGQATLPDGRSIEVALEPAN